jgi:hypothetical protein
MGRENGSGGGGAGIAIFLIILVVCGLVLWKDVFGLRTKLVNAFHSDKPVASVQALSNDVGQDNSSVGDWCIPQDFAVSGGLYSPDKSKIVGWSVQDECCVQSYEGWDCALRKTVKLELCYSSVVGGVTKWVKLSDLVVPTGKYQLFYGNLRKFGTDESCDLSQYPESLGGGLLIN